MLCRQAAAAEEGVMVDDERPAVLVVDDDADIREILSMILELHRLRVIQAPNGEEALARVRSMPIALVLLDLMMPGMNGDEVIREMRQDPALARLPVIVVSGDRAALQTAGELGANGCLLKPVELKELLREVGRFIALDAGSPVPGLPAAP
jgi:CheY-like chemotaxis protein